MTSTIARVIYKVARHTNNQPKVLTEMFNIPPSTAISYRAVGCSTLRDVLRCRDNAPRRFSSWCRVLHARSLGPSNDQTTMVSRRDGVSRFALFATDPSLQEPFTLNDTSGQHSVPYIKIDGLSSCVLSDGVRESLNNPGSLLFLKDVCTMMKGLVHIS